MLERAVTEIPMKNKSFRYYDYHEPIFLDNRYFIQMVDPRSEGGMKIDVLDLTTHTLQETFYQAEEDHFADPFIICPYDQTHFLYLQSNKLIKFDVTDKNKVETITLSDNIKKLISLDENTLATVHYPPTQYSELKNLSETLILWDTSDKQKNPERLHEFKLPNGSDTHFVIKTQDQLLIADENKILRCDLNSTDKQFKTVTLNNIDPEKGISSFSLLPNNQILIGDCAGKIYFYANDENFTLIKQIAIYGGEHNKMRAELLKDGKHALVHNSFCFEDFSLFQIWNIEKMQAIKTFQVTCQDGENKDPRHLKNIKILNNDSAFVYSPSSSNYDSNIIGTIAVPRLEPSLQNTSTIFSQTRIPEEKKATENTLTQKTTSNTI